MSTIYHAAIPVDLAAPSRQRIGAAQFFLGDNNSHVFTALVADTDAPEAELREGTVAGTALRADGVTVALPGEKGAETVPVTFPNGVTAQATPCSVTLPQAAFAVPGSLLISIKLTEGTTATTVLAMTGTVVRTETDTAVDPGEVIPDIAAIQAAAAEATAAAEDAAEAAEDATAAAADARAAASSAVRYDTAQSLTDAQQAQARGNIGIDGAVNFAEQGSTQSVTAYGVTATRTGNRVTLNGTTTYNGALRFRMGGSLTSWTGTPTAAQNAAAFGAVTVSGRIYVCEMRLISGTATGGVNESPMYVTPMKAGTTSAYIGSSLRRSDYYSRAFVSDGTGAVLWIGVDPGTSFTDAVFEVTFRDATVATQENENIAPADAPVATATHAAGSMLTVGGQLYKATQTIVAGETITPETNVTTTTVAAQLAALEARIAALEG